MINGKIYNIMIGAPSDVLVYAEIAINCVNQWNVLNTFSNRIALIPSHWSLSSFPSLEDSAQRVINSELVDGSDALIAIFGSRLGSPTKDSVSGTVEEIQKHVQVGKHVMVFFRTSIDANVDLGQIKLLQDFKNSLNGLYATFDNEVDFRQKLSEKLHLFVQKKLTNNSSVSISSPKSEVEFSSDEIEIIKKWTKSNASYLSFHSFIGGRSAFSFGGLMVETSNPKETAEMEDFVKRMLACGYIEITGYVKKGNAKYRLTLLGYRTFGDPK